MRTLSHPMILGLAAAFALSGVALPADAASFYQWETDTGAVAFTDSTKRIPERYRAEAVVIEREAFDDYHRMTPVSGDEATPHATRLENRLEHLRLLNAATTPTGAQQAPSGATTVAIRSGRTGNVIETTTAPGDAPVVVEKVRVRANRSMITQHWTVVRQGDRVVSVVKPRDRQQDSRWLKESDLLD